MNRQIAERWVAALRSGKFRQTIEYLHKGEGYCCLGVLCELAVEDGAIRRLSDGDIVVYGDEDDNSNAALTDKVLSWAGMKSENLATAVEIPYEYDDGVIVYESFAGLNDNAQYSFEQIAQVIEAQVDDL